MALLDEIQISIQALSSEDFARLMQWLEKNAFSLSQSEAKLEVNYLDCLRQNPIPVSHPVRFSRDELHERI